MTAPAILTDKLNVSFADAHVVKDLSLSVQPGESYGIVGESGSGKSTVLRVLAGLNRDWSGGVEILGKPSRSSATRPSTARSRWSFRTLTARCIPRRRSMTRWPSR